MSKYQPPVYNMDAFNCPFCEAYSNQKWSYACKAQKKKVTMNSQPAFAIGVGEGLLEDIEFAQCAHCNQSSIWFKGKMIFPNIGTAPLPNADMPDNIKEDYEEARKIINISPRGSAALLRLGVQKLCEHLGEKGENLNQAIKNLVIKGLPVKLQKALDSVRVIGNNAVHPGQIDLKDDVETAQKLFGFINIICDAMISQPKQIDEFYEFKIPDELKNTIKKRDGK